MSGLQAGIILAYYILSSVVAIALGKYYFKRLGTKLSKFELAVLLIPFANAGLAVVFSYWILTKTYYPRD